MLLECEDFVFRKVNRPCNLRPSFFCLNYSFQMKKIDALKRSFDRNLISPNMSRDTQKHLFDLCMSQIFTLLAGKI